MPFRSQQAASLGERVQRLLREGASAQAAEDPRRLTQVRDGLWQLLPEAIARAAADGGQDLEATGALIDIARPGIVLQLASGNWPQVLAVCNCMNIALANVEAATHRDDTNAPALEKMIVQLLHGFPQAAAEAGHRLGDPASALLTVETLTSVVAGMRMRRVAAEEVDRRMRAGDARGADIRAYSERWMRVTRDETRQRTSEDAVLAQLAAGDREDPLEQFFFTSPHTTAIRAARTAGRALLYLVPSSRSGVPGVAIRVNPSYGSGRLTDSCWVPALEESQLEPQLSRMREAFADADRDPFALDRVARDILDWTGAHIWDALATQWPDLLDGPLAVIPIGETALLPLYAATFRGGPACSALDMTLAPSARALYYAAIHQATPRAEAFVAADPWHGGAPLPLVGKEAAEVAAIYHTMAEVFGPAAPRPGGLDRPGRGFPVPLRALSHPEPYDIDPNHADIAKSTAIFQRMRTASVIHLACHGSLDGDTPALFLDGQPLPLHFLLHRDHELEGGPVVVLSACELGGFTAKTTPLEQLGFPAGLMALGARSVVGALWPLPDSRSTIALMRDFHERLTAVPSTAALPQAIASAAQGGVPPLVWGSLAHFGA
jgi:hypothetical protein